MTEAIAVSFFFNMEQTYRKNRLMFPEIDATLVVSRIRFASRQDPSRTVYRPNVPRVLRCGNGSSGSSRLNPTLRNHQLVVHRPELRPDVCKKKRNRTWCRYIFKQRIGIHPFFCGLIPFALKPHRHRTSDMAMVPRGGNDAVPEGRSLVLQDRKEAL